MGTEPVKFQKNRARPGPDRPQSGLECDEAGPDRVARGLKRGEAGSNRGKGGLEGSAVI